MVQLWNVKHLISESLLLTLLYYNSSSYGLDLSTTAWGYCFGVRQLRNVDLNSIPYWSVPEVRRHPENNILNKFYNSSNYLSILTNFRKSGKKPSLVVPLHSPSTFILLCRIPHKRPQNARQFPQVHVHHYSEIDSSVHTSLAL